MNYQLEHWHRQDWQKGTRYYSCQLCQNLFGEWVVQRRWGRVSALKGQSKEQSCHSYEEGLLLVNAIPLEGFAIAKRREQRGYRSVS